MFSTPSLSATHNTTETGNSQGRSTQLSNCYHLGGCTAVHAPKILDKYDCLKQHQGLYVYDRPEAPPTTPVFILLYFRLVGSARKYSQTMHFGILVIAGNDILSPQTEVPFSYPCGAVRCFSFCSPQRAIGNLELASTEASTAAYVGPVPLRGAGNTPS